MGAQLAEEQDIRHLRRAIELAGYARGQTSPNPLVGAVVVKGSRVIGEGFHASAGEPHAERVALGACEEDPSGATMYVSLEPCAHTGRTPPCTDAITEAGIARVVVASDDPSEKASGRGLGVLRDEGISVATVDGEVADAARLLNQPFRKHARTGRPLVIFKSAMTLDGKVATASGDSQWISGESSRARAHRWRSECDAVAVGIHTVAHDDPLLTARVEGVSRQPRRVIFDSEASLSPDSKLVRSAGDAEVIVVCSRAAKRTSTDGLRNVGVEVIVAAGANEAARVRASLDELGARDVQSLLLEGGPHLAGVFLEAGEIDEVRMFVAPMLLGGRDARAAVEAQGVESIAEATRAMHTEVERIDDDVLDIGPAAGVVMFTGLVQSTGSVAALTEGRLEVEGAALELDEGGSVAVNGVCLTATAVGPDGFAADVMAETLRRTALGDLRPGARVNLELPLRAGDPMGGHVVQGHVDGVGSVAGIDEEGFARVVRIGAGEDLLRYVVEKGSIAVDGVSLTVAAVDSGSFSVSLIPETLERTTFGDRSPGDSVNLEVDVLAKYVEKLVSHTVGAR